MAEAIRQIPIDRSAKRRRMSKLAWRDEIEGWLFASPWIIGFVVFTAGPMIASIALSLFEYDFLTAPNWVGLNNYVAAFTADPLFWKSLAVTSIYSFVSIPLMLVFGFMIALLMNQKIVGIYAFRTIYYIPTILPSVAVAYLWSWILNPQFGLLNYFLSALFGIKGPGWLASESWALPALIIM